MNRLGISILSFAILLSCSPPKAKPPANLIPEDKMIDLMIDIRLLEGAYSVKYREVDTSAFKIETYYRKLFKNLSITGQQFSDSYSYYSKEDGKIMEMENVVMDRLSEMQAFQEKIKAKIDSTQTNTEKP